MYVKQRIKLTGMVAVLPETATNGLGDLLRRNWSMNHEETKRTKE
jgi:hypothetical protein